MATYNSEIGYQTLIERIESFFTEKGFVFNIPPYEVWLEKEIGDEFYENKGWKTYLTREHNYKWFEKEDDHDSYFMSGYFSKSNGSTTELIQLNISSKKTVVPVYGLDLPEINKELNDLSNKVGRVKRTYTPFSTLYHDMMWSTWTGGMDDVNDVFLSYASDKKMNETINKIKDNINSNVEAFFQRGISEKLLNQFQEYNFFNFRNGGNIGTLENEELIMWYFILANMYKLNCQDVFKDIQSKLCSGNFNDLYKKELNDFNLKVLNYYAKNE
jgi:hypothetical protein